MPEAITKYAVNSTLGTERFKPLDKIIREQYRVVASNNVYATFPNVSFENEWDGASQYVVVAGYANNGFAMLTEGSAIITLSIDGKWGINVLGSVTVEIEKNGNTIYSVAQRYDDADVVSMSHRIDFWAGDIFKIKVQYEAYGAGLNTSRRYGVTLSDIALSCDIKPNILQSL